VITARELRKTYGAKKQQVEAVRGVDLDVGEGELVALLGPNGAGKSTTLRMLTTLLLPTSGEAIVAGHDVLRDPAGVRRRIGSIGQGNGAGHYHHVRDELLLQGRAYGLGWREARSRADELLEVFDLTAMAKRTAGTLSGGQRRRLDIALGLVHHPPLLFLDEPSTGLDPQSRANLWEHVLAVRERTGTTIVLTTHYLDEADRMAERVLVIDHGRIIADDSPARLKAELAGDRLTVRLADPASAPGAAAVAEALLDARELRVDGPVLELRAPDGDAALPALLRALEVDGSAVAAVELARPTLDDVFLSLTGRSLREGGALLAEEVAA
jgi:ABC-2 type transport system ATP-binding protein